MLRELIHTDRSGFLLYAHGQAQRVATEDQFSLMAGTLVQPKDSRKEKGHLKVNSYLCVPTILT